MHRTAVKKVVLEGVLDANDALAQANRARFDATGTYVINMMSSPGAGKTALLERTLDRMRGKLRLGVLEGDVQTTLDADRLARFHVPLVQGNTDPGFGGGRAPGALTRPALPPGWPPSTHRACRSIPPPASAVSATSTRTWFARASPNCRWRR